MNLQKISEIRLEDYGIETYATHNEGKSVVTERFIGILENKIYELNTK